MAGGKRRPPTRDRQEGEVERSERGHSGEQIGVAREVDRPRTAEDVPERWTLRAARATPAVVLRLDRVDAKPTELDALPGADLPDVREPTQQPAASAGQHDRELSRERAQRGQ